MEVYIVSSLKKTFIDLFDGYQDDLVKCRYHQSVGLSKHYFYVETEIKDANEVCSYLKKIFKDKEPNKSKGAVYKILPADTFEKMKPFQMNKLS